MRRRGIFLHLIAASLFLPLLLQRAQIHQEIIERKSLFNLDPPSGVCTQRRCTSGGPRTTTAQPPTRMPHIGVLSPQRSTEPPTVQREPFAQGLRALGWEPGASLLIEHRYAEGEGDRLPALAAELAQLPADVLVARGPQATRAAQQATGTIPIVMSATPDPVRLGFVASLARPRGNITGLAFLAQGDLEGKRLELLKETLPGLARVAFLVNWGSGNWLGVPDEERSIEEALQRAARSLRLEVQTFAVSRPEEIAAAFTAMGRGQVDGLLVAADPHVLEPPPQEGGPEVGES